MRVSPMFVGNVDVAQRDRIAGWAADTEAPNDIVEVVVVVDGGELCRVRADTLRLDLRDLGHYGEGRHGFDFSLDFSYVRSECTPKSRI
jgi:O-antigen biosynthesis protein